MYRYRLIILVLVFTNILTLFYGASLEQGVTHLRDRIVLDDQQVKEKSMPIVAVSQNGEGVMGQVNVRLIPGSDQVLINTNPFIEPDLQYSVNKAVYVANQYNHVFATDYIYTYDADSLLIGGGSAGAATAILTMAAIQNITINDNVVITGTVERDGSIGRIGGVLEKAQAVAEEGYSHFLVPDGQAQVTYYEKEIVNEPVGFGIVMRNVRYVPHTVDLQQMAKEEWDLTVVEVSNIEEAIPYFFA